MGTGIYVHMQFRPEQLVKGDTFFDADYGDMIWNGAEWVCEDGNMYQIEKVSDVWPGAVIYIENTGHIVEVTHNRSQYDRYMALAGVEFLLLKKWRIYKFN